MTLNFYCQESKMKHHDKRPRASKSSSVKILGRQGKSDNSSEVQPFRFLDLAPELRNRIYDHALVLDPADSEVVDKKLKEPALLSTCRQVREEARIMWYSQNDFAITILDCDATLLYRWLKHMSTLPDTFESSLAIYPKGRYDWKNLLQWCEMVHAGEIEEPFDAEEEETHLTDGIVDDRYDAIISHATKMAHESRGISWQRCWRSLEAFRKTKLSDSRWSEFSVAPRFEGGRCAREPRRMGR